MLCMALLTSMAIRIPLPPSTSAILSCCSGSSVRQSQVRPDVSKCTFLAECLTGLSRRQTRCSYKILTVMTVPQELPKLVYM
jgi:hypothetical protein